MKQHISAIIIGSAIVLAAIIYACATRHIHVGSGRVLDKWTGKVTGGYRQSSLVR